MHDTRSPDIDGIDFLPAEYHQRQRRRHARVWRRGLLAVFLLLIVLGAFRQQYVHSRLRQRHRELAGRARLVEAQLGDPDVFRSQIASLTHRADLLARLRYQTATSRLLATIAESLPEQSRLVEVRFETFDPHADARGSRGRGPEENAPTDRSPAERDLRHLAVRPRRLRGHLEGVASSDVLISRFLSELKDSGHFTQVQLLYTGRHDEGEREQRAFAIRVVVRPPKGIDSGDPHAPEPGSLARVEPGRSNSGRRRP